MPQKQYEIDPIGFLFATGITFIVLGYIFHWFDGIISFIWLLIQVLVVFLIIGGVIYLIYHLINQSKYGVTLRQFTRPWIGIVLIISLIIYAEYLFFRYGFQDGFTIAVICYQVFLAIVILCLVASPLILEKSFISTKYGIYILSFFIIGTVLGTISEDYGGYWAGRVFLISLIFSTIFIGFKFIIPVIISELDKEKTPIGKKPIVIPKYEPPQFPAGFPAGHITGNKITIYDIDKMEGIEFESILKTLFENMGYSVYLTPITNDYGADLILSKFGERISVQAKNTSANVGIGAVQEVVGSLKIHKTQLGWVVCSSYFTNQAITLANLHHVELWDRDKLNEMLNRYPIV